MYRDGLCEHKFRVRSLHEIDEDQRRSDFATSTPGMTPIQALEVVRGFARALQEFTAEAQREVVQPVFQRIGVTDDRITYADVYPVYAEALRLDTTRPPQIRLIQSRSQESLRRVAQSAGTAASTGYLLWPRDDPGA